MKKFAKIRYTLLVACCLLSAEFTLAQRESEKRLISIKDIISTRKLLEPQISPDGEKVAFVVQDAFLEKNENRSSLFVVKTDGSTQPAKLIEAKALSSFRWTPNGDFITYPSSESGSAQIWRISPNGGKPEQVTRHATGVGQYAWSVDGRKLAFVASDPVLAEEKQKAETQGVVYGDSLDSLGIFGVIAKSWIRKPQQLWIYDTEKHTEEKVWEHGAIMEMAWSPDATKISVTTNRFSESADYPFNIEIGFISLDDRKYVPLVTWGGVSILTSWSPDSKSIAFLSYGGVQNNYVKTQYVPYAVDVRNPKPYALVTPDLRVLYSKPLWSRDGRKVFFTARSVELSAGGLYEVSAKGGGVRKITKGNDHLSEFSLSADQSIAACIRQNPTTPPEVAVLNLKDGVQKNLTSLHPEYQQIRLANVSELRWKNKYGNEAYGFLIKPTDYVEGKQYPLLVILYSFSSYFFTDVYGNYPIQAFAANGYAVLLVNKPLLGYHFRNFKEGSMAEAYNPLASIEEGTQTVVRMGIADPKNLGIMGWSYGGYLTELAITHSTLFGVASTGDGGAYNPGGYWFAARQLQPFYDGILGGPPRGETYKNWQDVSPALNAGRVRIPVLMEYVENNSISALEFYNAVKTQGGQIELVIYPGASHIFSQPKQKLYSMQRNLDWFNFWMLKKEDPDTAKQQQYTRWRSMRENLRRHH